ncbi:unnamed protein product [Owenia fusiformis]|uniref:Uncharacterized protein n=1 Tax=Owenia fusiformis TaxID=6347 RepID=A0A8J1UYN0_OWEFU|nr:unnamed protein product [Owenia fusiformis]
MKMWSLKIVTLIAVLGLVQCSKLYNLGGRQMHITCYNEQTNHVRAFTVNNGAWVQAEAGVNCPYTTWGWSRLSNCPITCSWFISRALADSLKAKISALASFESCKRVGACCRGWGSVACIGLENNHKKAIASSKANAVASGTMNRMGVVMGYFCPGQIVVKGSLGGNDKPAICTPNGCSGPSGTKSASGGVAVTTTFRNTHPRSVLLMWITFSGTVEPSKGWRLAPGGTVRINTNTVHPFVAKIDGTNEWVRIAGQCKYYPKAGSVDIAH